MDMACLSLVEEFKFTKARQEITLSESPHPSVQIVGPPLPKGRKWTPGDAVQQAKSALYHADIVGLVQHGTRKHLLNGESWWS